MTSPILKVSVLMSGSVLLDGEATTLEALARKIESVKDLRPVIWYYREAAQGEPPPEAMNVMKIVAGHRLPVSLCSKSDFSDYVDRKGISHPRETSWENVFAKVRAATAGGKYVGIVRPDRTYLLLAPPPKGSVPEQLAKSLEQLVPRVPSRNIGIVADTYFAMKTGGAIPTLPEANEAIPFFGMILGFGYLGHSIDVFQGTPEILAAGCKDTDLLLIDSAALPSLPADWKQTAIAALRNANIVIHDRATFQLRQANSAGAPGKIDFPN
jgi:hypothetical protein